MNRTQEFITRLDDDCLKQIIADYEQLETEGAIGDCTLRTRARELIGFLGAEPHAIMLWMEMLAKEAYRVFAHRYLESVSSAPVRMGCHCDIETMEDGFEPDGCVIDTGDLHHCIHASPGMQKEECQYWKPVQSNE